jgi:hypothetical protein
VALAAVLLVDGGRSTAWLAICVNAATRAAERWRSSRRSRHTTIVSVPAMASERSVTVTRVVSITLLADLALAIAT